MSMSAKHFKTRYFLYGTLMMLLFIPLFTVLMFFSYNIDIFPFIDSALCFAIIPFYSFITKKIKGEKEFALGILFICTAAFIITIFMVSSKAVRLLLREYGWDTIDPIIFFLCFYPVSLNWCIAIIYSKLIKRLKNDYGVVACYMGSIYSVIIYLPILFFILESLYKIDDLGTWATLIAMLVSVIIYLCFMFREGENKIFSITVKAYLVAFTLPAVLYTGYSVSGWGVVFYVAFMPMVVAAPMALEAVIWCVKRLSKIGDDNP